MKMSARGGRGRARGRASRSAGQEPPPRQPGTQAAAPREPRVNRYDIAIIATDFGTTQILLLNSIKYLINPRRHWGSKGALRTPRSMSNFWHFHAVFGNITAYRLAPPVWQILDPPLDVISWALLAS